MTNAEAMNTTPHQLTRTDIAEMTARALALCPDLHDADMVVITLQRCGLSVHEIGAAALGNAIESARVARSELMISEEA